jgi:anaerobic magnesium-protoporphyrin IX monomethyl ester cyclase
MNIKLVFPPSADPSLPHGALPLLGAILKREGVQNVSLRDLNLEAFDDMFSRSNLHEAINNFDHAISKNKESHNFKNLRSKIEMAYSVSDEVINNIDEAREILRDKTRFYKPEELLFAKRIFYLCGVVLSAPYLDINFGKYSYSTKPYDSFEQIEVAIQDEESLLANYFHRTSIPSLIKDTSDVIGISVPYFSQLIPAFLLAKLIRKADPSIHITMGGPVITWGKEVLKDDLRFSKWIDSFFIGEADKSLVYLVEALEGKRGLDKVPNIVLYDNGKVKNQFDSSHYVELDWLPTPDFSMLPLKRYFAPKRIICITPTRGCYFNKCAFCNYSFIKLAPYRMRSPELIAKDIFEVKKQTNENIL